MGLSNISDKVVVITGASSGVGESTARLLAGNGAKVVLGGEKIGSTHSSGTSRLKEAALSVSRPM
jgi:NADP-dependent 3-hydroxy acid dehydrogenase YdfG